MAMSAAWVAAGFVIGAVIGSFIGVLCVRLPQQRGFARGRSACDQCGRQLRAFEMVPLLSFASLRGRCRTCGGRIDPALFVIELLAAVIGAMAVMLAVEMQDLIWALFGWTLLLLAALDIRHYWLPDPVTAFLAAAGLAAVVLTGSDMLASIIGGVVGFAAMELIRIGYRALRGHDGMGGGDPKLLGAIGIWTGWQALPFVLLGAASAGLVLALVWKLRGDAVDRTTRVPLGACFAVSAMLFWFVAATKPLINHVLL